MHEFYTKNKQAVQNSLILCGGILGCFLFFHYLFSIFLPFILGWLLSLLFIPLADKLEKHRVPRWAGALAGVLLLLSLLALLGYYIGSSLMDQMDKLKNDLPFYLEKAQEGLDLFWSRVNELLIHMPAVFTNVTAHVQDEFFNILFSMVQGSNSVSAISAVPKMILGSFVALFSSYFLTKDRDLIHQAYHTHVQPLLGLSVDATKKDLGASIWAYIKTQFILMLYVFVVCLIGLFFLDSPYALLLSVCIGIIDSIPFFGSGFILWPAALISFIVGSTPLALGYLIIYGVVQVLRQLMQPKILSSQLDMHPLLTLFSMYFGYRCIGFFGLMIGPIIAIVLRAMLRMRQENNLTKSG